ncbi:MAG: DNA polymerase III subunit delta [Bacteroidales bacterium]|jgi:DNA polymerase III|nr:DNA polymerase III subunit delta [Bacteroidales bacterium]
MKFSDVIGNKAAASRIRRMVDEDRFPHALLIHGQAGVPKLALAQATAQYIHCTNRTPDGEPCGQCPSCLQHQSFNHADTFFSYPIVKKDSNDKTPTSDEWIATWQKFLSEDTVEDYQKWVTLLGKDNAQPIIYQSESDKIIREMSFAAYTSKYKVLIMWLPEKMNEACANKLLKMIEEPAPDCIFLLVSDDAQSILPTIYSRCQRIELKRPSTQEIARYIVSKYGVDYQDALAVSAPADGNVVQAVRNMQLDSETKQFHADFVKLMRLSYMRDLKSLKDWSEHVADYKREKTRRFLTYCARMVRENFIYNLHVRELNYETREEEQFSTRFAPYINEDNVERMLYEFGRAEKDIRMNGNAKIVLFDLAIKTTILIKV